MEKKHDLLFCPNCGVKLEGDEMVCSVCGYKLAELHPVNQPAQPIVPPVTPVPPPPPVSETPSSLKCPNCGVSVDEHELFCNGCGARLSELQNKKSEVVPPPPPVSIPPVVPPVVTEPVKPPVSEAPPAGFFCPECGTKIEGSDPFCPECGTKITKDAKPVNTTPPPPVTETPVTPPATNINPPVTPPPAYQQPIFTPEPARKEKKGMGTFMWILIIFFGIVIIGGGTAALLQYTGTINVPFLAKFIPSKQTSTDPVQPVTDTNYYVLHSFASTGNNQWEAVVSSVVVSKQKYNNKEGAINQFKKAVMKKFPKDSNMFTNSVLCEVYKSLSEAQSGRSSLLKNYNKKKYRVRSVDVKY